MNEMKKELKSKTKTNLILFIIKKIIYIFLKILITQLFYF